MPRTLTIINSGSSHRWEDTAAYLGLGISKRHNLDDPDATDYYFITDGVAHPTGRDHPDTATAKFVAPSKPSGKAHRYLQPTKRSIFSHQITDFIVGCGLRHQAQSNVDLYHHLNKKYGSEDEPGISQLTLIGFSRGGAAAIEAASHLRDEAELSITLMPLDPVPGYFRSLGTKIEIGSNVNRYISTLSVHETSCGGLELPIGPAHLSFSKSTTTAFVPMPGDHLACLVASQDLVRLTLSSRHPLYAIDSRTALFGLKLKRSRDHYDKKASLINRETMAALTLYHNNTPHYSPAYMAHGSSDSKAKKKISAIDNYFVAFDEIPKSLMADTDRLHSSYFSVIATAQRFGRTSTLGIRTIHATLFPKGKREYLFFNSLHMELFKDIYPKCFKHLSQTDEECKLDTNEINKMPKVTRANVERYAAYVASGEPFKLCANDSLLCKTALSNPLFFVHPSHTQEEKTTETTAATALEHK